MPSRGRRAGARARSARASRGGVSLRSGWTPTRSSPIGKNGFVAERLGDDECSRLRPPERDLLPAPRALDLDHLERRSGQRPGTTRWGTPSRFAIAAQSRLWRSRSWSTPAGRPSDAARSIASGQSTGSTSQTPSAVGERVRRPRHRLLDDPGEPVTTEVVAEADRHPGERSVARSVRAIARPCAGSAPACRCMLYAMRLFLRLSSSA